MIVTRFAPSPTGFLHLGHAYSALLNWTFARERGGHFLLRIEDIDTTRCRPHLTDAILEDLAWLGLDWDGEVEVQSRRMKYYEAALSRLRSRGLIYADARSRAQRQRGGTARSGTVARATQSADRSAADSRPVAWRLDLARALAEVGSLGWTELSGEHREADVSSHGDVILARKDIATSYHLAVTVDDAEQRVTHVIRGRDLRTSTPIHRLLQELLGLPEPLYEHHPLILDERTGRRFAKRDGSVSLRTLREQGQTPLSIRRRLGL